MNDGTWRGNFGADSDRVSDETFAVSSGNHTPASSLAALSTTMPGRSDCLRWTNTGWLIASTSLSGSLRKPSGDNQGQPALPLEWPVRWVGGQGGVRRVCQLAQATDCFRYCDNVVNAYTARPGISTTGFCCKSRIVWVMIHAKGTGDADHAAGEFGPTAACVSGDRRLCDRSPVWSHHYRPTLPKGRSLCADASRCMPCVQWPVCEELHQRTAYAACLPPIAPNATRAGHCDARRYPLRL